MTILYRRPISGAPVSAATAAALVVLTVHVALAEVVGTNGWDDGAITLAFARTFADSGRIALTPLSETVEGFSSPLWLLIMAGTRRATGAGFEQMVLSSQIWAGAFSALGAGLLFLLVRRHIGDMAAWALSVAIFISAGFLNETMNGMEMTALATLAVAVCLLLDKHDDSFRLALLGLAIIAPWIRLEAAGYMIVGALGLLLFSRQTRAGLAIAAGTAISLLTLTMFRWVVFGELLPNTMLAKQWPPYRPNSVEARASSSLHVAHELAYLAVPFVAAIALAVAYWFQQTRCRRRELIAAARGRTIVPVFSFGIGYLLAVAAFNVYIGKNLGYRGRMELSIVPILGTLAALCVGIMGGRQKRILVGTVILILLLMAPLSLQWKNLKAALGRDNSILVTPADYRTTGMAFEAVRTALGRTSLDVMTPDVGGSSLCCSNLRIIDVAMLANHELATKGYADFDSYLERIHPDIIEIHGVWAGSSGIYDSPFFRTKYTPIVVGKTWLYTRIDNIAARRDICNLVAADATRALRYRGEAIDEEYVKSLNQASFCSLP